MFFTRDRDFYKTLVRLAIPIALQNAVTGGKSTDAIAQENLMAKVIKSRQAKEAEAKAGAKVNMIA